jgi:hypothetical protein
LPELDSGEVAVPDVSGTFPKRNGFALRTVHFVEEAQIHAGGAFRIERKIDARAIPGGALGVGFSGK